MRHSHSQSGDEVLVFLVALIASEWGESENKRKAKYYRLTRSGAKRLRSETEHWSRLSEAIATVLEARSV